jgi:DEAD/DEAH box helicase domain-containing protein
MTVNGLIQQWRLDPLRHENIAAWQVIPPRQAITVSIPETLHPQLRIRLRQLGIDSLYKHQKQSLDAIQKGKHVVIVTETASGKTLAYNLPVADTLLKSPSKTALYLFPTKALTQDQLLHIRQLTIPAELPNATATDIPLAAVYDGDIRSSERATIRKKARILLSNPDMLHFGILPHHPRWVEFFTNLQYVLIDEMHTYRGIFGTHVANVLRRLRRITSFYGSNPQFILTSATIANPAELAAALIGQQVECIDQVSSPRGERHFLIYNPPVIDENLGIRRGALLESTDLAEEIIANGIQTIIFCRSRRAVEIMLRDLQSRIGDDVEPPVRGYRSGYLSQQRRRIEKELRARAIDGVVTTNALEVGIDIGSLDASIIAGYPGSIAATWQQAGRSGRRDDSSLIVLVTGQNPLDQYLAHHPEYFFAKSPEHALINPDNLMVLVDHLQCAIYELPFSENEIYGGLHSPDLQELLQYLADRGSIQWRNGKHYWISPEYPASKLSLRNASADRVLIQEQGKTIGEVDLISSHWMVHPGAIYLQEAHSYLVDQLDLEQKIASVSSFEADYYTEPNSESTVELIERKSESDVPGGLKSHGDVLVTSQVKGFRKVRWYSQETLGFGKVDLPPVELHTQAYWITLSESTVGALRQAGYWSNDANEYGPDWEAQKQRARHRDGYRCQLCGEPESGRAHHVHHKIPFRAFSTAVEANKLTNLITLCPRCHRRAELAVRVRSGLAGLGHVIYHLAPLFLMCDIADLGLHTDPKSPMSGGMPVAVLYERFAAGLGFSQHLVQVHSELIKAAYELVATCPCDGGCPSCVGPGGEGYNGGKREALEILNALNI